MNTKIKKGIISSGFFILLVILTFYIIFKEKDIGEIINIVVQADKRFVLLAILSMCCFVMAEGINISRTLKLLDCKINFINGIKYALVGFFFSSVTPSASGGDPMQLYYMKKDGLPLGQSALAILTEFSSFQFVTVLMALIGFITNYKFIEDSVGNIKYLLMIGVLINLCILTIIILSIFSKKIIIKLVDVVCNILGKFKFKKVDEFKNKCIDQINEYKNGAKLLIKNSGVLFKIVTTTIIQITLFHSIPFFIYLSLGLDGANFFRFLSLQSVLYISVSSLPFPGAVGVSEGGFMAIYNLLFPAQILGSAMLLSRGISFYLFVILSGLSLLGFKLLSFKRIKHA